MSGSRAILDPHRRLRVPIVAILKSFFAVSALLFVSGCAAVPASRLGQEAQKMSEDHCIELFETAWMHIDRMKALRSSSQFTLSGSLISLFNAEDDADRHRAYEREGEQLEAIARVMTDRNCPHADLQSAIQNW